MYHDQVLAPMKTIMGFKAINITLGIPFIRVSPDHGVGEDITGKRKASPVSLIQSIKLKSNHAHTKPLPSVSVSILFKRTERILYCVIIRIRIRNCSILSPHDPFHIISVTMNNT